MTDSIQVWQEKVIREDLERLRRNLQSSFTALDQVDRAAGRPMEVPKGATRPSSYWEFGSVEADFSPNGQKARVVITIKHYSSPGQLIHAVIWLDAGERLFGYGEEYYHPADELEEDLSTGAYLDRCTVDEVTGDVWFAVWENDPPDLASKAWW